MSSFDKDTNILDDKKEAVAMTPFPEKKLLTTEKVTISDQVHKRIEKFTTSEEVVKCTDEVHKDTENITANEEVDKEIEILEDMKEAVVVIRRKDSDKFEVQYKGSTGWFNIDLVLKKRNFLQLNQISIKTFLGRILKVQTWNRVKNVLYRLTLLS